MTIQADECATRTRIEARPVPTVAGELVVVHRTDGTLAKGILQWNSAGQPLLPPSPLPGVLHLQDEASGECVLIPVSETKAVFLVKKHAGAYEHDEVKFFSDVAATDLWIRVKFADGEVLEGQAQNDMRLLVDPGIWLRPFDSTGNNVLVYVPKSSVVEFHVMGVAIPRPHAEAGSSEMD